MLINGARKSKKSGERSTTNTRAPAYRTTELLSFGHAPTAPTQPIKNRDTRLPVETPLQLYIVFLSLHISVQSRRSQALSLFRFFVFARWRWILYNQKQQGRSQHVTSAESIYYTSLSNTMQVTNTFVQSPPVCTWHKTQLNSFPWITRVALVCV